MYDELGDFSYEEYMGYKIFRNHRTIWKKNKISGHEWPEYEPLKTVSVDGYGAFIKDYYRSVDKAKEHIDFLISVYGENPKREPLRKKRPRS